MMNSEATFHLRLPAMAMRQLIPLFHSGVGIKTVAGISLMELLCGQLGIGSDIVREQVQTIFVNGRAVDKTETVEIAAGAVIALSAAMPGLVGASLRKGGVLAGFRQGISYPDRLSPTGKSPEETIIVLKLFNLVAETVAPQLLQRGVWVKGKTLQNLLTQVETDSPLKDAVVEWNGVPLPKNQIGIIQWPDGWVELRATPQTGPAA